MKTSETIKLIANALAYEKSGKAQVQSAGRELIRLAGKVEELERSAMLAALPEADALDGVGNLAMEGQGGSERKIAEYASRILQAAESDSYLRHVLKAFTADDGAVDWERAFPAVAVTMAEDCGHLRTRIRESEKREKAIEVLVEQMASADPDIAKLVQEHTNDRRVVDYAAVLLELVRILDRQNDDLARQFDDVAAAEADLTAVWMCGAERGRDVIAAIRTRIVELAEDFEDRSLAYDAMAAAAGENETVSAREAWRRRADLAFEVAEALSRVLGSPRNGLQAAGNGPSVDFQGPGGIRGQVLDKSQPAAGLGRFTAGAENGQTTVVCKIGAENAIEAAGGAEHG